MMRRSLLCAAWLLAIMGSARADDLTALSLEELLDVEVTSVGKKAQMLADAAAAIFVISEDDIRRSGATSVPEALRMVPGIEVKRLDSNKWAISARGFSGRFANKLLVMLDGRTVYTPSYSGVYWEYQDVLLADIERIEVIRGPGAALWGANAVNGVINIITKSAKTTQGGLVIAGGGSEERALASFRYGAKLASDTFARAYVKYHDRDSLVTSFGDDARDAWETTQGGFRLDSTLGEGDRVTLQGDLYRSNLRQQLQVPDPFAPPTFSVPVDDRLNATGWNLLARWDRALSVTSDVSLQLFYDHAERSEYYASQRTDVVDLEFQQHAKLGQRHDLVWGLGYRRIEDWVEDSPPLTRIPGSDDRDLWNLFIQDEITLIADRLHLTLGSKFEHNDYTGFEVQPTIRLLWRPTSQSSAWAAVSQAVRTPARAERTGVFTTRVFPTGLPEPGPQTLVTRTTGNPAFDSETLTAYELGYRITPTPRFNLDLALFYNDYGNLRTAGDTQVILYQPSTNMLVSDFQFANQASGNSYGLELAADLHVRDWWRLALAYTYLDLDVSLDPGSQDRSNDNLANTDPRQQLSLRSLMNPRKDIDLDLWLRYVDQTYPWLSVGPFANEQIPAYWELDVRLAWRPAPNLELSLVGQNLLQTSHPEGYQDAFAGDLIEVERGVYAAVRFSF